MNNRLIAAALRQLAEAIEAPADTTSAEPPIASEPARRAPRRWIPPTPETPVDEVTRARARRDLKAKGYKES